jgi:hypothetical protein
MIKKDGIVIGAVFVAMLVGSVAMVWGIVSLAIYVGGTLLK